jgi:hypothetical protein
MATAFSLLANHWFYNTETGQLTQGNDLENLGNNLVGGLGWHELNISGNATADQAAAEAKKEFPTGKTPTNAGITPARVASTAVSQAGASIPGVGSIDDAINFLKQGSIWERGVEIVAGLILLYVGIKAVATPAGTEPAKRTFRETAASVAKVVAK